MCLTEAGEVSTLRSRVHDAVRLTEFSEYPKATVAMETDVIFAVQELYVKCQASILWYRE